MLKSIPVPKAKKEQYTHKKFEDEILDNYHWLKKKDDPEVLNYIEKENHYSKEKLKILESLKKDLFQDMKNRLPKEEYQEPIPVGEWFYYKKWKKEKTYPYYIRRKKDSDKEQLILDVNALAEGKEYFDVSYVQVSPNHNILTYALDEKGREFYNIYFKNLTTEEYLTPFIPEATSWFVWANDNETLFYVQQDQKTLRNFQVYRFNLKTGKKELLYTEEDEKFSIYINKSLCQTWIFLASFSTQTTEYRYLPANQPSQDFKLFAKRKQDHEYHVHYGEGVFYILTNKDKSYNFKLMQIPESNFIKKSAGHQKETKQKQEIPFESDLLKESNYPNHLWKDLIPHREDVFLEEYEVFKNFIAFNSRKNCRQEIECYDLKKSKLDSIDFKENTYSVKLGDNREFESSYLRLIFQTPIQPPTIYDYEWKTKQLHFKSQKKYSGNFSTKDYQTEFLFSKAPDGTLIPISLVYKKSTAINSSTPLLLYGYGSYGFSLDPVFDSSLISILNQGFVYAKAHIRGGSEGGRKWYEKGRLLNKKNTFKDFIACAEFLIEKSYSSPKHFYIMGESAGGLLMGSVLNEKPELFRGAVARVPFVDCLATMLDKNIPLSIGEYEEWGNPNKKTYYDYIKSYSPYNNVKPNHYPYLLVESGYHDPRVQYWEPVKWVAKLRELNQSNHLIALTMNMKSGHFGSTGRLEYLKLRALCYSFFIGIEKKLI